MVCADGRESGMNTAILSGKGGTGKTTVSTNLALMTGISYVDCDVEEPNGFLFLNPRLYHEEAVTVEVPVVDKDKCDLCGACSKVCQFHALAKAGREIIVFEKLCHDCGACRLVCGTGAITFKQRITGSLEYGTAKGIDCRSGILNIGEPMAVPVIRKLVQNLPEDNYILDCPPGTSCNVANTLKYADAAVLVTEPSEFGYHDLVMAIELVKLYRLPFGVIINKDDGRENKIKSYCRREKITLFGTIPYSAKAAALYSRGVMLSDEEEYKKIFSGIAAGIKEEFGW